MYRYNKASRHFTLFKWRVTYRRHLRIETSIIVSRTLTVPTLERADILLQRWKKRLDSLNQGDVLISVERED